MRVPAECLPNTTHTIGADCPCGHRHQHAPDVLRGPARRGSNVGYVITDDRLYQQVGYWAIDDLPRGVAVATVRRTVGTIQAAA